MKKKNGHWYLNGRLFLENILEGKTLKNLYDSFYLIPKDNEYKPRELELLESLNLDLKSNTDELEKIYIIKRGVKNHKLSEENISEIKELLKESQYNQTEIAKKYNVSKATITKIKQDKYYK